MLSMIESLVSVNGEQQGILITDRDKAVRCVPVLFMGRNPIDHFGRCFGMKTGPNFGQVIT